MTQEPAPGWAKRQPAAGVNVQGLTNYPRRLIDGTLAEWMAAIP